MQINVSMTCSNTSSRFTSKDIESTEGTITVLYFGFFPEEQTAGRTEAMRPVDHPRSKKHMHIMGYDKRATKC
jgi:hypothetical protein